MNENLKVFGVICSMLSLSDLRSAYRTYRDKKDIDLRPANAKHSSVPFHQLVMNDISGKPFDFAQLKGKKTLIVNTASECKFTTQYALLEEFYLSYKDKVNVLGFPCNDFGAQESGSADEIVSFCTRNYGVSFTMFEKVDIKNKDAEMAPVYQWLSDKKLNGWCSHVPHWNFCKYLVDEQGELLLYTNPVAEPKDPEIMRFIV